MSGLIEQLQQQLGRQPDDAGLYYELGRAYLVQQQVAAAAQAFSQALRLAPNHPQILMQLGNVASMQGDEAQAGDYFEQSLLQDPKQADVHYNLANSLRKQSQPARAIQHYQLALQLNPQDADSYNNLGNAYRETGELSLAVQAYEAALGIAPNMLHAKVHWIHQKQHMADWHGLDAAIAEVRAALASRTDVQIPPFAFLAMPGTTHAEQTHCASQWAQQHYGHICPLPAPEPRPSGARIKIGYLSSDFRRHPLAYLVTDVIAAHDRTQFEVFLYSQAPSDFSAERQAFMSAADHWLDIDKLNDQQVAAQMRAQGLDILIDLTGYTQNSRSGIAAYRPARQHINWLGYPGSMGCMNGKPLFDSMIVDASLDLPQLAEQAIVLPCYQPNNALRPLASAGTRRLHGLPEQAFVFCNFNQSFKITSQVFEIWMDILNKVPNSVLWLLESNHWAVDNLQRAAYTAGVEAGRLIFAPRTDIANHIARQAHADLMLDTLPYNAHTTASDALWLGVPMLTVEGNTIASRVTTSLLRHIEMVCLICQNWPEYVNTAVQLASNQASLDCLRQALEQHKSRLFDPQTFTFQLEQALRQSLPS